MQIQGISPVATQPVFGPVSGPAAGGAGAGSGASDFAQLVRDAVDTVDQAQQASALSIQDLLAGNGQGILPVVAEVAKADMSFKLLMGVRNKVIEAYKQTINMQI